MNRGFLALLPLVGILGCSPKPGREFRGHWIAQNDGAAFQPCGAAEKWWATFDSALEASATVETTLVFIAGEPGSQPPTRPQPPALPPPLFTTLRGDTSSVGAYGPTGAYPRHLVVHEMGDTTGHCP